MLKRRPRFLVAQEKRQLIEIAVKAQERLMQSSTDVNPVGSRTGA
jgi:hypothetical protein